LKIDLSWVSLVQRTLFVVPRFLGVAFDDLSAKFDLEVQCFCATPDGEWMCEWQSQFQDTCYSLASTSGVLKARESNGRESYRKWIVHI
jgi:hypothetical protein